MPVMSVNGTTTSLIRTCSQPLTPWLQSVIQNQLKDLELFDNDSNGLESDLVSDLGLTSQPLSTPKLPKYPSSTWNTYHHQQQQRQQQQPSGPTSAFPAQERPVGHASGCQLDEIGEFLVRLIALTSRVASALIDSEDIKAYKKAQVKHLNKMHELSDFDPICYMSNKEHYLKSLTKKIEQMANESAYYWSQSPNPPYEMGEFPQGGSTSKPTPNIDSNVPIVNGLITNCATGTVYTSMSSSTSWCSEYSDHAEESRSASAPMQPDDIDYSKLNRRGKGNYTCPDGKDCTKGGFVGGGLVVFERNSSFRTHMSKHKREFKCDIPGCKNTAGFARVDQLKRHKIEVHHLKPEKVTPMK